MKSLLYHFITVCLFCSLYSQSLDNLSIDKITIMQGATGTHGATFHKNNLAFGIDFMHLGMDMEDSDDLSVNLFLPRVGVHSAMYNNDRITTYFTLEAMLLIPFVSLCNENECDEAEEDLRDTISGLGTKASYVLEYAFTDQLSLVSDIGIRWLFNDMETDFNIAYTFTNLGLAFTF